VAFITRDPRSVASARVRIHQYLPHLEARGIECRTRVWDVADRRSSARFAVDALRLARWADVVVLQKPRLAPSLLAAVARLNPRIVVDFDDAVWASRAETTSRGRFGERLTAAVQRASVVVPGSAYLGAWVERVAPGAAVEVIPPSVDLSGTGPVAARRTDQPVVLGWIGGPDNLADFTPDVLQALRDVQASVGVRLQIISSRALDVDGLDSELVRWSLESEATAIEAIDVGLMPLEDSERSRGRCSFKAIQYMAAAKPVVASPVGSATEVVVDGRTGILATTTSEWVDALTGLASHPDRRSSLGEEGRRRAVEHYSVAANADRWIGVLEQASAARRNVVG
jgi:glycosyltransferase involved in cell wall biosynthesis